MLRCRNNPVCAPAIVEGRGHPGSEAGECTDRFVYATITDQQETSPRHYFQPAPANPFGVFRGTECSNTATARGRTRRAPPTASVLFTAASLFQVRREQLSDYLNEGA